MFRLPPHSLPTLITLITCSLQVNPYQWLDGLYSESLKEAYALNEDLQGLPPHVFAISAAAFRCAA